MLQKLTINLCETAIDGRVVLIDNFSKKYKQLLFFKYCVPNKRNFTLRYCNLRFSSHLVHRHIESVLLRKTALLRLDMIFRLYRLFRFNKNNSVQLSNNYLIMLPIFVYM